ncbi:MAG TPA: hypothetical protein VFX59_10520 [Polyangiales bacterium]|nr:hypothetical protein [Polyangiales bacterium]
MRYLALLLLVGCERPVLSLAERVVDAGPDAARADADDDSEVDEDVIPCSAAADCPNPRDPDEAVCDLTRGACVECLNDRDCPAGERCDADGDCDD